MKKLFTLFALLCATVAGSAQVTFTATGGSDFQEGQGCDKALDQDLSTKWFGGGMDKYLLFEASETVQLTGYTFTLADDNAAYGRVPKEWEIFGSNDEAAKTDTDHNSWTSIQYVRGDNVMQHENHTAYYYALNTAKAYKYYKLKIVYGDGSGQSFQISEFVPSYVPAFTPSYTAISGVGGTGSEGFLSIVDGNTSSKVCTSDRIANDQYHYFIFRRDEATAVSSYRFCTGNDSDGRDPKNWELYGMNTNGTPDRVDEGWVLIDSKTDQSLTTERSTWTDAFSATGDNTTAYNTFMLKITSLRDGGSMTQFQEFRLNDDASGYTALDGVGGTGGEGYAKGFDGDTGTKVCTNTRVSDDYTYWFVFKTREAVSVSGYKFATGNDASERDPQTWTLYGMNTSSDPARDDDGWEAIDSKTNVTDFPTERTAWVHYDVDNPTANQYNYFKLEVTKIRNDRETSLIQFSEINLDEMPIAVEDKIVAYRSMGTWGDGPAANLFDGTSNTKFGGGFTTEGNGTYVTFGPANQEAVSINGYAIQMADEWGNYDRRPKSWTLYGGNVTTAPENNANWEEIHSVADDTELKADARSVAYYHLNAPSKAYKYFKLQITENQGSTGMQIGEFTLFFDHGTTTPWLQVNDGTNPVFNGTTTVENFKYEREFANEWATVCLPFAAEAKAGFQPYALTGSFDDVNGNHLTIEESNDALTAYQPTIVKTNGSAVNFDGSDVTVFATLAQPTAETGTADWTLVGATAKQTISGTDKFYIAQNKFWQADQDVNVATFRAYLAYNGTGEAKPVFTLSEGTTGIKSISNEQFTIDNSSAVYDLQGRRVQAAAQQLKPGVYVQSGRKFIVK